MLKRDYNTDVFLWTLQNFKEHLFWRTTSNDCFCIYEIQITNYILPENFIFNFRIYKIFYYLLKFLNFSSTEFVLAFIFFSHSILNISHNISNVSFSSSLNTLNAFSHYQKFYTSAMHRTWVLALFRDRDKRCTTASLIKVPPLKVDVYLILDVHCTLFADPT